MTTHMLSLPPQNFVSTQPRAHHLLGVQSHQPGYTQRKPELPKSIEGPTSWSGQTLKQPVHVLDLKKADVLEVDGSLQGFKSLEMDGHEINRERFPLPKLESRLDRCALEIHHGSGLCIIRGLDPEKYKYSPEDITMIFLGLSSYIGGQRGLQNAKGSMLSHVTESKLWSTPREKRHGIHTNESLPFHSDMGCEILAIQVRQCAEIGGRTCVAAAGAIFNDLRQFNPSALQTLARADWPIQTSFKQKGKPYVPSPLLAYHDGNLILSVDPSRIGPNPSCPEREVPDLTPEQFGALEALQVSARKHQIRLNTQPGDLIFLNNWSLLHAREAYHDAETSSRHLVRLWLRNETLAWSIPPSMLAPWDSSFGARSRRVINRYYDIVPMPEYMETKYTNGTAAFVPEDNEPESESEPEIEEGHHLKVVEHQEGQLENEN